MTPASSLAVAASLAAENISVNLQARPALTGVSFTLDANGLTALAGPNGAGKSTLLKALAGVLPPASGRFLIGGQATTAWSGAERARHIAYMPQDRAVHWNLPARTVVSLGRLPHRHAGAGETDSDWSAVARALALVDATHLADRPVLELSGGERARILMARALAQEARVLLADEPAAGLDPAHQWSLFAALTRVAEQGVRVIVAMHDLTLISRFAADVVLLAQGRLVAHGPPRAVFTAGRLTEIYGISAANMSANGHALLVPTGPALHPTP